MKNDVLRYKKRKMETKKVEMNGYFNASAINAVTKGKVKSS